MSFFKTKLKEPTSSYTSLRDTDILEQVSETPSVDAISQIESLPEVSTNRWYLSSIEKKIDGYHINIVTEISAATDHAVNITAESRLALMNCNWLGPWATIRFADSRVTQAVIATSDFEDWWETSGEIIIKPSHLPPSGQRFIKYN